jgi:nucleoside-diphosphate-sugar epimerase
MKVFCTGASGYIGGSVAAHLVAAGHQVTGLVRTLEKADAVRARGIQPLLGTLDDGERLAQAAQAADVVVNAASADHNGAVAALLGALAGSGKVFLHTSGSSIVGTRARGHRSDAIFDESSPVAPSPARAARVALNDLVLSFRDKACRPVIICPSLIYGLGHGIEPHSMQVPLLIGLARRRGCAAHAGPGENIWSNVHIDDLVTLYALAIEKAAAGAFFFAENGENSMREVCAAINRMLGHVGAPSAMSMEEAISEWGEGLTEDTMASNSRVRAVRARQLGWKPKAPSLIEEIEQGCYR